MKKSRKWVTIVSMGLVVLALTAVALPVAAAQNDASAVAHAGGPGSFGDRDTFLAEELGITVEELQVAQQAAHETAIQQAVDEGLITQAQADAMLARSGMLGGRSLRGFGGLLGTRTIDHEALLADELGISVDELQAARDGAHEAALQQAVADGAITQEQAELMEAQQALRDYMDEQDLQASVQSLVTGAVQDAVEAGVITQAQADTFLSDPGLFGRFGGMHGFGIPDGSRPFPDALGRGGIRGMPGW